MGPLKRLQRETKFLRKLAGTLWRVRKIEPDSDVLIDLFCAAAVERSIPEIAVTDHVDFDPRYPAYDFATYRDRERQVREAAEAWAEHGLAVRFGVEVTYERRHEAEIRNWLARHPHDFVIGSVHIGPDSPYRLENVGAWVAGRSLMSIVEPYFAEVRGAAASGLFDTVGHIDFVKRYLHPLVTAADFAAAPELYDPILRALVDTGTALEVNTSGLRQAPAETYPPPSIVERYRELGGGAVTTGSDAHRIESFAHGLGAGYRMIREAGFEAVAFRRGGERVAVRIAHAEGVPNRSPVRSL